MHHVKTEAEEGGRGLFPPGPHKSPEAAGRALSVRGSGWKETRPAPRASPGPARPCLGGHPLAIRVSECRVSPWTCPLRARPPASPATGRLCEGTGNRTTALFLALPRKVTGEGDWNVTPPRPGVADKENIWTDLLLTSRLQVLGPAPTVYRDCLLSQGDGHPEAGLSTGDLVVPMAMKQKRQRAAESSGARRSHCCPSVTSPWNTSLARAFE